MNPTSSLAQASHHAFIQATRQFDLLSREEEFELAQAWHGKKDPRAKDKLLLSHTLLVHKLAKAYRGYGLPLNELIAEGYLGMLHALHRFDPHRGFRFSTYALWWIRSQIQQYVLNTWSLVKIGNSREQKRLFFKLRSTKKKLVDAQGGAPQDLVEQLAKILQTSPQSIKDMETRLSGQDLDLNRRLGPDDEQGQEWIDLLADESASQEDQLIQNNHLEKQRKILGQSLESLNPREHKVLYQRRMAEPPQTLEALAKELGVSKERVRQIEVRAFDKVKKEVIKQFES